MLTAHWLWCWHSIYFDAGIRCIWMLTSSCFPYQHQFVPTFQLERCNITMLAFQICECFHLEILFVKVNLFIFVSALSYLDYLHTYQDSCLIYATCACLCIVVSKTYYIVLLSCLSSTCVPYVVASFSVHFWSPFRYSLTFIY